MSRFRALEIYREQSTNTVGPFTEGLKLLTVDKLKNELTYDPGTGIFKWKRTGTGRRLDLVAGTVSNFGYVQIMIDGERYLAHVLAWLYMTGEWPTHEIDHENRLSADNSWLNLRPATSTQNKLNSKTRIDNTSGHKGVTWDKQKNKWKVQISVKGMKRLQKHFFDFDDAVDFYEEKATELFGEYKPAF